MIELMNQWKRWPNIKSVFGQRLVFSWKTDIITYIYIDSRAGTRGSVLHRCLSVRDRGSFPAVGVLEEPKMFLPHPLVKLCITVESLCERQEASSTSDL